MVIPSHWIHPMLSRSMTHASSVVTAPKVDAVTDPASWAASAATAYANELFAARAQELAPRLVQVVGDDGHRCLDVAAANRLVQTAVLMVVVSDAFGRQHLVLHGVPLLMRTYFVDLAIEGSQQGIARAFGDGQMEAFVPPGEALDVRA